jgi:hypothetical protein
MEANTIKVKQAVKGFIWSQIWPFVFICQFWHLISPTFLSYREACPQLFSPLTVFPLPLSSSLANPPPHFHVPSNSLLLPLSDPLIRLCYITYQYYNATWNMLVLSCHGSVGSVKSQSCQFCQITKLSVLSNHQVVSSVKSQSCQFCQFTNLSVLSYLKVVSSFIFLSCQLYHI